MVGYIRQPLTGPLASPPSLTAEDNVDMGKSRQGFHNLRERPPCIQCRRYCPARPTHRAPNVADVAGLKPHNGEISGRQRIFAGVWKSRNCGVGCGDRRSDLRRWSSSARFGLTIAVGRSPSGYTEKGDWGKPCAEKSLFCDATSPRPRPTCRTATDPICRVALGRPQATMQRYSTTGPTYAPNRFRRNDGPQPSASTAVCVPKRNLSLAIFFHVHSSHRHEPL